MKKSVVQKKWEKISNESGWVNSGDEAKKKVLERNTKMLIERENKSASINTRIAPSDLESFKKIADGKAIPYQTLLGHIIHEYIKGKLVDVEEVKKLNPYLKTKPV